MPLGILDDKHMAMPPGTARLDSKFNSKWGEFVVFHVTDDAKVTNYAPMEQRS